MTLTNNYLFCFVFQFGYRISDRICDIKRFGHFRSSFLFYLHLVGYIIL